MAAPGEPPIIIVVSIRHQLTLYLCFVPELRKVRGDSPRFLTPGVSHAANRAGSDNADYVRRSRAVRVREKWPDLLQEQSRLLFNHQVSGVC